MNRSITITVTISSYNMPGIEELRRLEEAIASYDQEDVEECKVCLEQNRRLGLLLDQASDSRAHGAPSTLDEIIDEIVIVWNNRRLDMLDPTGAIRVTLADLRRAKRATHFVVTL